MSKMKSKFDFKLKEKNFNKGKSVKKSKKPHVAIF